MTVEGWGRVVATFIAPTTALIGLLYYFGYVRSAALYAYFGLDLGTLKLSTNDYLLRSVDALYVPLGCLLIIAIAALWIRWLIFGAIQSRRWTHALRRGSVVCIGAGAAIFFFGVMGVIVPNLSLPLLTPLSLGVGPLLIGFSVSVLLALRKFRSTADVPFTVSVIFLSGLIVLSLFWTANEYAQAYGRGRAATLSQELALRPTVILDTRERLFADAPGVEETALDGGGVYRYRYRGFRLFAHSHGTLFLIPEEWTPNEGAILVLPDNSDVRTQFLGP